MQNFLKSNTLGLLIAASVAATAAPAAVADSLPGAGKTVKPGIATDESRFALEVVDLGLEKLGFKIEPIATTTVEAGYVATAQGDLDIWGEDWEHDHDAYIEKAGGAAALQPVGVLVDGAFGAYVIDKKTADQYHINSVKQFADKKIAALFDSDGDGRANLAGCPVGWGCDPIIAHHLTAYGIGDNIQNDQGDFVVTHSDVINRFKEGKPVFYYTYEPLWLNQVLVPGKDAVFLEVPFSTFPDGKDYNTKLPDGRNIGFQMLRIRIVGNTKFLNENPAAKKLIEQVNVPIADVDAENLQIYHGEKSYDQIHGHAVAWVQAHQALFDGWVAEAMKAAK